MTINREDEWKIEGLEMTAPLDSDLYLSLEPLVNDVAAKEWAGSGIYELEDVVQAVWLHVMEHWEEYEDAGGGLVRTMARRAARTYCKKQRIDYMYANGAFIYTPGIVRRYLVETVFCDPEHASDLEARADIDEAMGHLPHAQRRVHLQEVRPEGAIADSGGKVRGVPRHYGNHPSSQHWSPAPAGVPPLKGITCKPPPLSLLSYSSSPSASLA